MADNQRDPISEPRTEGALAAVITAVLSRMNADAATIRNSVDQIEQLIQAYDEGAINSGTASVPWRDGKESSLVAAVGPPLIQIMRLGKDSQIRGEIWAVLVGRDKIEADILKGEAIKDYSSHESMRLAAIESNDKITAFKKA